MSEAHLHELLARARAAGADAADTILVARTSVSVERRLGQTDNLERSESRDIGLRVFVGDKSAIVSASSVDPARFAGLAERAVAMARVVPEDPLAGLADRMAPPEDAAGLDLIDGVEPEVSLLLSRAEAAEAAALAVPGITNSEGGSAGFSRSDVWLATSAGFSGHFARTHHSISASVVAGEGTGMQRDYDYHGTVHFADLDDPAAIGHSAAERAIARLNPTKARTARLPIIYDPRVAGSLVSHLSGAINGAAVARRPTKLPHLSCRTPSRASCPTCRCTRLWKCGSFDCSAKKAAASVDLPMPPMPNRPTVPTSWSAISVCSHRTRSAMPNCKTNLLLTESGRTTSRRARMSPTSTSSPLCIAAMGFSVCKFRCAPVQCPVPTEQQHVRDGIARLQWCSARVQINLGNTAHLPFESCRMPVRSLRVISASSHCARSSVLAVACSRSSSGCNLLRSKPSMPNPIAASWSW